MKKIKTNITKLFITLSIIFILVNISAISANELDGNIILTSNTNQLVLSNGNQKIIGPEQNLKQIITDSDVNDVIILEPGTYKVHNINLTRNITLQGNGNPRDIIIDGEKKSNIFLVENQSVYARFNNITFINGEDDYGGAISMYSGNVYVDNCHFINNTALKGGAGGAIANFGIDNVYKEKHVYAYLFVNNSFFINNRAYHDGGAITTDFALSEIYNSVFINNSAGRDGGAIRINREGRGNVQDCIFMFNSAKEWGGAYYSWVGVSNIERCVFLNNTAGTNGGAIMASAHINVTDSIIVNNTGKKTGGALYIQQPMNKENAGFVLKNNLITNNTSPLGKEIFIKWREKDNKYIYPYFDDNDWGDEDPNDPSIIDPNNIIMAKRRGVSSTITSNLLNEMDMGLMKKYDDLIQANFQRNNPNNANKDTSNQDLNPITSNNQSDTSNTITNTSSQTVTNIAETVANMTEAVTNTAQTVTNSSQQLQDTSIGESDVGNSESTGETKNAYELNEKSVAKQASPHSEYTIAVVIIVFLALLIGYRKQSKE